MNFKSIFFLMTIFFIITRSEACLTDQWFYEEGWQIHSSEEFSHVFEQLSQRLKSETIKEDIVTSFESELFQKTFLFQSWDDLKSPDIEMYGDIVFVIDPATQRLVELRWYEGQKKHLVYIQNECAMDLIPLATNTLF